MMLRYGTISVSPITMANLSGLSSKPTCGDCLVGKNAGRTDKYPQAGCRIVATSTQPTRHVGRFEDSERRWMKYDSHARKTNQERRRPRAAVLSPGLNRNKRGRNNPHQVLTRRFATGGPDLHFRNLHSQHCLALWLGMAHRPHLTLSPDDSGRVCHAGGVFVDCQP